MTAQLKQRETIMKIGVAALAVVVMFLIYAGTPVNGLAAAAGMAIFFVLVFFIPKFYPLWCFLFIFLTPTALDTNTHPNIGLSIAGNAITALFVSVFLWLFIRAKQQQSRWTLALIILPLVLLSVLGVVAIVAVLLAPAR